MSDEENIEETLPPVSDADPPPPSDPPGRTEEAKPKLESPMALAKAAGQIRTVKNLGTDQAVSLPSPQHLAAAQLHGWTAHRYHTGADFILTADDYQEALKVASGQPKKQKVGRPRLEPHEAACSPHAAFKKCDPTMRRGFKKPVKAPARKAS